MHTTPPVCCRNTPNEHYVDRPQETRSVNGHCCTMPSTSAPTTVVMVSVGNERQLLPVFGGTRWVSGGMSQYKFTIVSPHTRCPGRFMQHGENSVSWNYYFCLLRVKLRHVKRIMRKSCRLACVQMTCYANDVWHAALLTTLSLLSQHC
jgi:hypothetical protein